MNKTQLLILRDLFREMKIKAIPPDGERKKWTFKLISEQEDGYTDFFWYFNPDGSNPVFDGWGSGSKGLIGEMTKDV